MTTGLTPTTFENLQLNAGVLLKDFDYARWILAERITMDDVPARWREQVGAILKERETDDQ